MDFALLYSRFQVFDLANTILFKSTEKNLNKLKIENVRKQLKTIQNILNTLSSIKIDKINTWCKFQESTVIRF